FDPDWLEVNNEVVSGNCSRDQGTIPEFLLHFPVNEKAILTFDLVLPGATIGVQFALTDHYSIPIDSMASENALLHIVWEADDSNTDHYSVQLEWNSIKSVASLTINGNVVNTYRYKRNSKTGIN